MARRPSNTATAPTESKEDTVSTTTEAPAAAESETKAPEAEVDLTEFLAAVETAVSDTEARDATTGELPEVLIAPVNTAFRKLDGAKAKNKARKALNELMKQNMTDPTTLPLARSYMILADKLSAGPVGSGEGKAPRQPADPTEAFVQRVVGLRVALELATSNKPEGVSEDWTDKANSLYGEALGQASALLAWTNSEAEDKGDEPEASATARSAVKLAAGRGGRAAGRPTATGDGVRRDVAKHIVSAFADVAPGTFLSIAEIKKHESEEYKGVEVSAGAISARLFPASGKPSSVPGVEATIENNKKGARKVA